MSSIPKIASPYPAKMAKVLHTPLRTRSSGGIKAEATLPETMKMESPRTPWDEGTPYAMASVPVVEDLAVPMVALTVGATDPPSISKAKDSSVMSRSDFLKWRGKYGTVHICDDDQLAHLLSLVGAVLGDLILSKPGGLLLLN